MYHNYFSNLGYGGDYGGYDGYNDGYGGGQSNYGPMKNQFNSRGSGPYGGKQHQELFVF